MSGQCWIGTSGWVYPHWREVFYPRGLPQSRWLEHYTRHFRTVEINYSFYRLPSESSFDRWRELVPSGFRYAVKASRYITHLKKLANVREALERFLSRARRLGSALGPVLYQLPPRWQVNLERLEELVALLPLDLIHVFEFRDPSWLIEPVFSLLRKHQLSLCVYNMPGTSCPVIATADVVYFRFHGSGIVYGGLYGQKQLQPWAEQMREFMRCGKEIYVYFNNDAFGYAVQDALTLQALLGNKSQE